MDPITSWYLSLSPADRFTYMLGLGLSVVGLVAAVCELSNRRRRRRREAADREASRKKISDRFDKERAASVPPLSIREIQIRCKQIDEQLRSIASDARAAAEQTRPPPLVVSFPEPITDAQLERVREALRRGRGDLVVVPNGTTWGTLDGRHVAAELIHLVYPSGGACCGAKGSLTFSPKEASCVECLRLDIAKRMERATRAEADLVESHRLAGEWQDKYRKWRELAESSARASRGPYCPSCGAKDGDRHDSACSVLRPTNPIRHCARCGGSGHPEADCPRWKLIGYSAVENPVNPDTVIRCSRPQSGSTLLDAVEAANDRPVGGPERIKQ